MIRLQFEPRLTCLSLTSLLCSKCKNSIIIFGFTGLVQFCIQDFFCSTWHYLVIYLQVLKYTHTHKHTTLLHFGDQILVCLMRTFFIQQIFTMYQLLYVRHQTRSSVNRMDSVPISQNLHSGVQVLDYVQYKELQEKKFKDMYLNLNQQWEFYNHYYQGSFIDPIYISGSKSCV